MTVHRIAIVGAGRMAQAHAHAWSRAGLGEAISYVVSPRTRPQLDAAPHARWVTRLEDVLADAEVDLLSVCTPTPSHAEIAIEALRHGRNVPDFGWVAGDYLGIDQGPILTMIENYRSALVWRVMRKNLYLRRGLEQAGFSGGWLGPEQ